jgi:hypothetical protein
MSIVIFFERRKFIKKFKSINSRYNIVKIYSVTTIGYIPFIIRKSFMVWDNFTQTYQPANKVDIKKWRKEDKKSNEHFNDIYYIQKEMIGKRLD